MAYGAHQVDLLDEAEVPSLEEFAVIEPSEAGLHGTDQPCAARTGATL